MDAASIIVPLFTAAPVTSSAATSSFSTTVYVPVTLVAAEVIAAKEIFDVRPKGSSSVLLEVTASLKLTVTLITDPMP